MNLTVNGETKEVPEGISLLDLIRDLGVELQTIAIQHNDDIIDRKAVDRVILHDGDAIELIRIVGGG